MTLEIIIILLTIVLAVYFLFKPTSKKEKDRFEDKDNQGYYLLGVEGNILKKINY